MNRFAPWSHRHPACDQAQPIRTNACMDAPFTDDMSKFTSRKFLDYLPLIAMTRSQLDVQ